MTSIEKKMIVAGLVCIAGIAVCVHTLSNRIEQTGGLKGMIIKAGKAAKDIKSELDAYEPNPATTQESP